MATNKEYGSEELEITPQTKRKYKKRRTLDFEDGEKTVGWLGRIVELINQHGFAKIMQALFVAIMIICSVMLFNAMDNIDLIEKVLVEQTESHTTGSQIRSDVNPKITKTLTHMLYEMNGDRASILEMHNGKENPTSLPFIYCDMTYEETRGKILYVSDEYENMNMSKFTFPDYLYRNRVFIGTIDEIYSIDKKLAMRLETNDVKYAGIIIIRTTVDIGFLMISYTDTPTLSREEIYAKLTYYVQELGIYLDYGKQMEIKERQLW